MIAGTTHMRPGFGPGRWTRRTEPTPSACSPASGRAGAQEGLPLRLASQARHKDSPRWAARCQLQRHLLLLLSPSCQHTYKVRVRVRVRAESRKRPGSLGDVSRPLAGGGGGGVAGRKGWGEAGARCSGRVLREPRPVTALFARLAGSEPAVWYLRRFCSWQSELRRKSGPWSVKNGGARRLSGPQVCVHERPVSSSRRAPAFCCVRAGRHKRIGVRVRGKGRRLHRPNPAAPPPHPGLLT